MTHDDTWFRHKGKWPLTERWPDTPMPSPALSKTPELRDCNRVRPTSEIAAAGSSAVAPITFAQAAVPDQLLTTSEAAAIVRLSPRTLERLRVSGKGPRFLKAGSGKRARVLYRARDLDDWLAKFCFASTSEYPSKV